MDKLERSPEIEADIIREAVQRIRLKDQWCLKKYQFGNRLTYWDADNARHALYFSPVYMKTSFGEEIILTGNPAYSDEKRMVFHVNSVISFQFLDKDHLKDLFRVYKVFKDEYCIDTGQFNIAELEQIRDYCLTMDQTIRKEADKVRVLGVVQDIFAKFWNELGGDLISPSDRVGNRVRFYKDLVTKFKGDKKLWTREMVRMKLIVG